MGENVTEEIFSSPVKDTVLGLFGGRFGVALGPGDNVGFLIHTSNEGVTTIYKIDFPGPDSLKPTVSIVDGDKQTAVEHNLFQQIVIIAISEIVRMRQEAIDSGTIVKMEMTKQ